MECGVSVHVQVTRRQPSHPVRRVAMCHVALLPGRVTLRHAVWWLATPQPRGLCVVCVPVAFL